jgi:S-adenosylmethionine synthetase
MPDSATNPLQLYGRTKRDGEVAVLGGERESVLAAGSRKVVLRVPVL